MQKKESGWDMEENKYHASVLDTDNNRVLIQELILSDFPNASIDGFQSRPDDNKLFSLTTKCSIPYSDIYSYYENQIIPKSYCGHEFTLEEIQELKDGKSVNAECETKHNAKFSAKVKLNQETHRLINELVDDIKI